MPGIFDPLDNPFLPRRPQAAGPALLPADESDLLGGLMEGSLGGLSYLGKVMNKTFGGRAVRGALGGKPQELLSVLPMSDTLGITNEADEVHGKQLLQQHGLIDNPDDWSSDALGLTTEIGLDPATWIGAGVPRALAAVGGKVGGAVGRNLGAATAAATGGRVNPYTYGAGLAQKGQAAGRALFDTTVGGSWLPDVQQHVARDVFTPTLNAGRAATENRFAEALDPLDQLVKGGANRDKMLDALTLHGEGHTPEATAALAAAGLNPVQVNDALALGGRVADDTRNSILAPQSAGVMQKSLLDMPDWQVQANQVARDSKLAEPFAPVSKYFPRSLRSEPPDDFARVSSDRLSGASEFNKGREEVLRGIPRGAVGINDLVKDPTLSTAARTKTDLQVEDQLLRTLTGHGAGTPPPAWITEPWGKQAWDGAVGQARKLSDDLKSLPEQAQKEGLFSTDFLGNAKARQMDSARTVASGEAWIKGATQFARPVADLQRAGIPYVRVPELLEKAGLTHVDPLTRESVAGERIMQGLGLNSNAGALTALRDHAVPADVAADIARIGTAYKTPEVLKPVIDTWDKVVNLFKTSLTTAFPAFHTRNLMSGVFNMWRDNSLSPTATQDMLRLMRGGSVDAATAAKLYPGVPPQEATHRFLQELVGANVAFTRSGQTADRVGLQPAMKGGLLPGDLPAVGGTVRPVRQDVGQFLGGYVPTKGKVGEQLNPVNTAGVRGESDKFIPVERGRALGNSAEDWIRGSHYLAKRLEGATPADAKLAVMKYQIDYGDLTQFEQHVMKRLFPWYTFSRKNLPTVLADLAEKPGKIAATTRAVTGTREPGEFVPPWVAEGAAMPIPGAPDGQKRFVASFGLPIEDELVKVLGSTLHGDHQRVLQQLIGMSQPFVKLPAEVATDTQMFSGRKLEDLRPYEFMNLGGLLPEDVARKGSQVIANTPASRVAGSIDKLIDERKGAGPTALNTLSGVRVQDVDVEQVKDRAARQLLQDLLKGRPGVRVNEEVYVPKDQRDRLSEKDMMELDLLKEIRRRQQARAREKVGR